MKLSDEGKVHWEFITGMGIGIEFFDDEDEDDLSGGLFSFNDEDDED